MTELEKIGAAAKSASKVLALAGSRQKEEALEAMARALDRGREAWIRANDEDMEAARAAGMRPAMLDRLKLTHERIDDIIAGVRQVKALPDPIGRMDEMTVRPNGLQIGRRRVPLGVIAIIFEARPNVAVDAAALCLKSGNACILRGGSDAIRSNIVAAELMREALTETGLPADCICLLEDTSRETAAELMHLNEYVDVLIPRGGAGLIRTVVKEAGVPVIRTGEGVCHIYIDEEADLEMGAKILYNAKCSRPSVCNAAECVLIHRAVAEEFLSLAVPMLLQKDVELRCDAAALRIVGSAGIPATDEDWDTEYDDYILAVKIVDSMEEALQFIDAHGTQHSEAIVTKNYFKAQHFLDAVDAAAVYVNASTRFTDGGEFGKGAEIGISTQKMHARGPMGLEELTSYKYVIYGDGQVR